ncbi:hypothetical protein [Paenibacillus montanisoli]|uniref:Cupin domain-containing protein n=1 Tax=Paenibacillus montanisoli TaxID=2081970 RepID=A0A328U182_9BACL|nr:hypothetical protein [Paenibacillus montanisoli]RAP76548.1 hypothetical protein DL346_14330 [Paenibacillus montanisoli]
MKVQPLQFTESFIEPVMDNGVSKVVKFSFPKDKELQKHKTTSDILVFVLDGHIRFVAGEEFYLKAGDMINVEKEIEHSITALEKSIVLVVMTPSPSYHTILKPSQ